MKMEFIPLKGKFEGLIKLIIGKYVLKLSKNDIIDIITIYHLEMDSNGLINEELL